MNTSLVAIVKPCAEVSPGTAAVITTCFAQNDLFVNVPDNVKVPVSGFAFVSVKLISAKSTVFVSTGVAKVNVAAPSVTFTVTTSNYLNSYRIVLPKKVPEHMMPETINSFLNI